jgi:hypothetical protein
MSFHLFSRTEPREPGQARADEPALTEVAAAELQRTTGGYDPDHWCGFHPPGWHPPPLRAQA